ncbi:Uncharacterised protein [Amycolatopsis camponoti]|uniref:Uncharacterized protein n=1 Tax=Amycolatopsis camponoti TaxID=2606593 RepID=A0A6I8M5J5_9PSEU|nr:Uncharacterised protein [Amycolatopsis camponoti]
MTTKFSTAPAAQASVLARAAAPPVASTASSTTWLTTVAATDVAAARASRAQPRRRVFSVVRGRTPLVTVVMPPSSPRARRAAVRVPYA